MGSAIRTSDKQEKASAAETRWRNGETETFAQRFLQHDGRTALERVHQRRVFTGENNDPLIATAE